MKLIILYGPTGVGKKTVGELLAKKLDYKLFDSHVTADLLRAYLPDAYIKDSRITWTIRILMYEAFAKAGVNGVISTIAGGNEGSTQHIEEVIEVVEKNGGEVQLVDLQCDKEELVRRVQGPSRKFEGSTKITTPEELEEFLQKDYFKGVKSHKSLVIDTTNLSPEQTADEIIFQLN